mmetsp:Transcript_20014/g.22676  ORF Transcript_20014/g.22676 Transcript_20014/m.22676 type:complete len:430 (-) Transcript_20014:3-1292(-)
MNLHHLLLLLSSQCVSFVDAFQLLSHSNSHSLQRRRHAIPFSKSSLNSIVDSPLDNQDTERHDVSSSASASSTTTTRRSLFQKSTQAVLLPILLNAMSTSIPGTTQPAQASVGTLPEFNDSNSILQSVTIDVSDKIQQDQMIDFLREGFSFKLLRQRKTGDITDTWMGFGPEEMNIPSNFELPVSSFAQYGGHASIHIRYDSQATSLYYKAGDDETPPGDNIAYIQVGVPGYRISQMVKYGGFIMDAYGIVNVVSPSGLPMRGIVGITPDPMMFVALNCQNLKSSREFYEQIGFVEQEYPYCRPNKGMGQFEPPQPKNSIYLAPSKNSIGVLLLQPDRKKKFNNTPNPAFRSMNIVYTPTTNNNDSDTTADENSTTNILKVVDPSGAGVTFKPYTMFENEELNTRVAPKEDVVVVGVPPAAPAGAVQLQ